MPAIVGWLFEIGATALALQAGAPAPAPREHPVWLEQAVQRVDLYGRFDGFLSFSGDGVDFSNNSSRFGIKAEQALPFGFTALAQAEWRVNLGQGDLHYNISENPDTGLGTFDSSSSEALQTRLGFLGLRFGKFGTLTLGKQWGVYYDVSRFTDRFVVFGATGSSTYNAGTDGGQTGEGRANDAVAYRAAVGPVSIGLQAQFLDTRSPAVDSVSGSLLVDTGLGLRFGAAYSRALLRFSVPVVGYDGHDAQAFTAGAKYEARGFLLASVNTWTQNHELVSTASGAVMYDTLGAELITGYAIGGLVMPYGGFDFAVPRRLDSRLVSPNFGTRDVLGGVRVLFDKSGASFAYLEGRTGGTRDADGVRARDVVNLGIRFEYSLRRALGL